MSINETPRGKTAGYLNQKDSYFVYCHSCPASECGINSSRNQPLRLSSPRSLSSKYLIGEQESRRRPCESREPFNRNCIPPDQVRGRLYQVRNDGNKVTPWQDHGELPVKSYGEIWKRLNHQGGETRGQEDPANLLDLVPVGRRYFF